MQLDENVFYMYSSSRTAGPLQMKPKGCPETSVTTNQCFVVSQISEQLIHTVMEAWNHAEVYPQFWQSARKYDNFVVLKILGENYL